MARTPAELHPPTATDDGDFVDLPAPWSPKQPPSVRELSIHALKTTLLSIRQQTEAALAQLAALEAGAPARANDPRMEARGSIADQAANVFGHVQKKQREGA